MKKIIFIVAAFICLTTSCKQYTCQCETTVNGQTVIGRSFTVEAANTDQAEEKCGKGEQAGENCQLSN